MKAWKVYSDCLENPSICYGETRGKLKYQIALTQKELWGDDVGESLCSVRVIRAPEFDRPGPLPIENDEPPSW